MEEVKEGARDGGEEGREWRSGWGDRRLLLTFAVDLHGGRGRGWE